MILKFSFFNLRTVCLPLKKRMTQIALIACEMMVASAGPILGRFLFLRLLLQRTSLGAQRPEFPPKG